MAKQPTPISPPKPAPGQTVTPPKPPKASPPIAWYVIKKQKARRAG